MGRSFVDRHGFLSTRGNVVVDQHMVPVVLRGMSLYWSQWQPQFYNASVVRWLRDDWQANAIRVPLAVHHGGFLENPQRELAKIEQVIVAAIKLGVYVVVDWHTHKPEVRRAVEFFSALAKAYASFPNIIYEIWNEPDDCSVWDRDIVPFCLEVIPVIRCVDNRNIIVVGTERWCTKLSSVAEAPLHFDNLAYALHFYAATHGEKLRDEARNFLARDLPIFVTEWGTSEANGRGRMNIQETALWWDFLEANRLSYLNWSLAAIPETSAALRAGASPQGHWHEDVLSPSGRMVRAHLRERSQGNAS